MSWCDKKSIEHIKQIRDRFEIKTFVETGTFCGMNAMLHSENFKEVLTCEIDNEFYKTACEKLKDYENVHIFHMDSSEFLKDFVKRYKRKDRKDIVFIFLDAHFFVKGCKNNNERFVALQELKVLKDFKRCVICVHDFKNNLGSINYDGIDLDFDLLEKDLKNVNPNFYYYTNTLASCDIHTEESIVKQFPEDNDALDNIKYARSSPRLTYRGILYCIPQEINTKEMGLTKWGKIC